MRLDDDDPLWEQHDGGNLHLDYPEWSAGPLGLDSPTVVVQVKSESGPVGVSVVNELNGALSTYGATQALLVAWGGLPSPPRTCAGRRS